MATEKGKLQHKESIMLPPNSRKRCIKRHFQGIHHRFVNDPEFRASQLEHDRDEEVCIKMDELVDSFHHYDSRAWSYAARSLQTSYDASRILSIHKELVDFSQYSGTSGPLKKSFWLQRGVVHITPSTPRIWRTTTQASVILEVSILAPIIEFFLQLVAMERFPGGALNNFKCKSRTWAT